jgi:hypothetical protein
MSSNRLSFLNVLNFDHISCLNDTHQPFVYIVTARAARLRLSHEINEISPPLYVSNEIEGKGSLRQFNRTFDAIAREIAKTWPKVTPQPEQGGKAQAASALN